MSAMAPNKYTKFKSRLQIRDSGCHEWTGYRDPNGYGRLTVNRVQHLAHRYAWRLHTGKDAGEQHVLHTCDNPSCCNPAHLFLGDAAANHRDKARKCRAGKKLNAHAVRRLRAASEHLTYSELSRAFQVSEVTVHKILSRQTWKHV